jgi:DNA-directed RNA polymerase subunit RPC12/RpoP
MRVKLNGPDDAPAGRERRAATRSGHLMLWIVLFVIGCTVLGPGIVFGLSIGWGFLPWVLGGFFLFPLIFFIRAVIRASGADQAASMWRGVDFRETMQRLSEPVRSVRMPEKESAPRPVRLKTRCPSCGAAVAAANIQQIDGVPAVNCPYCGTLYPLEDAEPV